MTPTENPMPIRIALLLLLALPATTLAQGMPEVMPYQGFITTAGGEPVEGQVDLTFRIYETSDALMPIWQETIQGVPVEDGTFYVYLGMQSPVMGYVTDGRVRYLGITVNQDGEARPRQRVGSVPYAMYAGDAALLGGEPPDVFVTVDDLNQEFINRQVLTRVQIEELVQNLVVDRQGVTLEEINQLLDDRGYVTEEQVNALIDARGYLTQAEIEALIAESVAERQGVAPEDVERIVQQLIDAGNYVTADEVNALIDARGYLTQAEIEALIDARGYLTEADVVAIIDARDYLDEDAVNALIDARDFVDADEVNAIVEARVQQLVDNELNNIQQQIDQLQVQVQNGAGGKPYILGASAQTSNGRFSFNGANGMQAANEMCRATYADEATAHFCTPYEAQRAIIEGSYDANNSGTFDNVNTWTVAPAMHQIAHAANSLANTCQNLMYNSGDVATGTRLTVILNYQSQGNGGGVNGDVVRMQEGIGCGQTMPVLCCR